ncbi:MAG: hypothetical protein ACTSRA_19445, partial [Promethearchaeota archaeon]
MNKKAFLSKKRAFTTVLFVICVGVFISNLYLIPHLEESRPINGGFTRELIYIKDPSSINNSSLDPGYFVLIDDISAKAGIPVEMLLHGLGELSVGTNNCTWTTDSGVSLAAMVTIPSRVSIINDTGYYFPTHGNPIVSPYVKIRPPIDTSRIVTFLFPFNTSMQKPVINCSSLNIDNNFIIKIEIIHTDGGRDVWFFHEKPLADNTVTSSQSVMIIENLTVKADYAFVRLSKNGSIQEIFGNGLSSLVLNSSAILDNQTGNTVYWNGSFLQYSIDSKTWQSPQFTSWTIDVQDIEKAFLNFQGRPNLYFNDTEKEILVNRCHDKEPWKSWYSKLLANIQNIDAGNIEGYDLNQRHQHALNLAFVGYIEGNLSLIDKSKQFLLRMQDVEDQYTKHLRRSYAASDYALALDLISNNISEADRQEIENQLERTAKPLYDDMYRVAANNWRVVMADGLASAGFVLRKPEWIKRADDQLNWYLQEKTRAEGGCFEGQGYAGYTWIHGSRVCYLLKRMKIRNYFNDTRFIQTLNFTIQCVTPNSYYPLFEDCAYSNNWNEVYATCKATIYDEGYTELATNLAWLDEAITDSTSPVNIIRRIIMHRHEINQSEPRIGTDGSIVMVSSGMACFR